MAKQVQKSIDFRFRLRLWLAVDYPCRCTTENKWVIGGFHNGILQGDLLIDDKFIIDDRGGYHGRYFLRTYNELKEIQKNKVYRHLYENLLAISFTGRIPLKSVLKNLPLALKWDLIEPFRTVCPECADIINGEISNYIATTAAEKSLLNTDLSNAKRGKTCL